MHCISRWRKNQALQLLWTLAELDEVTVGEEKIHIIPEIDGNDLKLCHGNCIFFVHGKNLMKLTHEVFERCTK